VITREREDALCVALKIDGSDVLKNPHLLSDCDELNYKTAHRSIEMQKQ
jgi:hypothetical protein